MFPAVPFLTLQPLRTTRLSQDVLAAKMQVYGVGLGREAISRIETGDRFVTDYELAIFARVLGVSLVWLTGDLEQKE